MTKCQHQWMRLFAPLVWLALIQVFVVSMLASAPGLHVCFHPDSQDADHHCTTNLENSCQPGVASGMEARRGPPLRAPTAPRPGLGIEVNHAALNAHGHPEGQARGHGLAGPGQNATEGLARDSHVPRRLELRQTFHVGQAQGLKFIEREDAFLQVAQRDACRLEIDDTWKGGDAAGTTGTSHGATLSAEGASLQGRMFTAPDARSSALHGPLRLPHAPPIQIVIDSAPLRHYHSPVPNPHSLG